MTISKDLYLALLSMDAYNREYSAGIDLGTNTSVGAATIKDRQLIGIDPQQYAAWQTAGFYAAAYTMGDDAPQGLAGKTVISYRGTDNTGPEFDPIAGGTDILQGWIAGIGEPIHGEAPL